MLLENKTAVIYGAAGSLGSAIAKAFAAAGATVFVTGRHGHSVEKVAAEIRGAGGNSFAAEVDAMDPDRVAAQLEEAIARTGRLDISFNLISLNVVQGIPLTNMKISDFVRPVQTAMQAHFITATAAARKMRARTEGVILTLTATPGGIGYPLTAGFAPACAAIESFSRNLAAEEGIYGIRVVNIRSAGSPDSAVFREAIARMPEEMTTVLQRMNDDTMLKSLPPMKDITATAVFLASAQAGSITGVTIDVTAGTTAGLNYRMAPGVRIGISE